MKEEEVYAKGEAAGDIATPGGLKLSKLKLQKNEEVALDLKWLMPDNIPVN